MKASNEHYISPTLNLYKITSTNKHLVRMRDEEFPSIMHVLTNDRGINGGLANGVDGLSTGRIFNRSTGFLPLNYHCVLMNNSTVTKALLIFCLWWLSEMSSLSSFEGFHTRRERERLSYLLASAKVVRSLSKIRDLSFPFVSLEEREYRGKGRRNKL